MSNLTRGGSFRFGVSRSEVCVHAPYCRGGQYHCQPLPPLLPTILSPRPQLWHDLINRTDGPRIDLSCLANIPWFSLLMMSYLKRTLFSGSVDIPCSFVLRMSCNTHCSKVSASLALSRSDSRASRVAPCPSFPFSCFVSCPFCCWRRPGGLPTARRRQGFVVRGGVPVPRVPGPGHGAHARGAAGDR